MSEAHEPAQKGPAPRRRRIWLWVVLGAALVALAAAAATAVRAARYVDDVVEEIKPDSAAAPIEEEYKTPPEYAGDVVNVLVCGVDSSEDREYQDGDGMTDLILYVQFDVKNHTISMFQIPRNTFVGGYKLTMENGDVYRSSNANINSIMRRNATTDADGNEVGNVNALVAVIYNMYKLPVDYYVTLDMDALVAMVDHMGGVDVYVPFDIEYKGSKLEAGTHTLLGEQAEFFVRNRHGAGYEQADIARLNMQRYFYQGLFAKLRSLTVRDIVKLMPVVAWYVKTDMDLGTILQLAVEALQVDASRFMMCQSPVYMDCTNYGINEANPVGYSIVVAARQENADLLNQYFRRYTGEVPAEELNLPDYTRGGAAPTDANVQWMGELDAQAGNVPQPGSQSEAAASPAA